MRLEKKNIHMNKIVKSETVVFLLAERNELWMLTMRLRT